MGQQQTECHAGEQIKRCAHGKSLQRMGVVAFNLANLIGQFRKANTAG